MSAETKIEWCDSTFNAWIGCTRISPACDNCYAARSTPARTLRVHWGPHEPRHRTGAGNWALPQRWNRVGFRSCRECDWRGEPDAALRSNGLRCPGCGSRGSLVLARRRVFCASLSDVFDNAVPTDWFEDLFALIRVTPEIDWLILTKRPQNIVRMVRRHGAIAGNGIRYLPDNVRLGTTAEDQTRANLNLPYLLATREELGARSLFVSIEPMLSDVDLTRVEMASRRRDSELQLFDALRGQLAGGAGAELAALDWVIVGGESGPGARPMVLGHAKGVVRQCRAAGVPVLVKQLGACPTNREGVPHQVSDSKGANMDEWPAELRVREFPAPPHGMPAESQMQP